MRQFWEVLDLSWGTAAAVPDVADAAATGDDGDALPDAIPNDAVHDHFGGVHDHSGWDHRDEFEHRAHHDGYDHAMEVVDDSQNDSQVLLEPEYGETDTTVDSPEPDAEAVTSETTNPSLSVAPCEDAPSADTAQPDKSPMLGEPNRAKTKDASAKIHALRCSVKEKSEIPMSKKDYQVLDFRPISDPCKTQHVLDLFSIVTSSTAQGGGGSFKNRKPIGEVGCYESGMAERSH